MFGLSNSGSDKQIFTYYSFLEVLDELHEITTNMAHQVYPYNFVYLSCLIVIVNLLYLKDAFEVVCGYDYVCGSVN